MISLTEHVPKTILSTGVDLAFQWGGGGLKFDKKNVLL